MAPEEEAADVGVLLEQIVARLDEIDRKLEAIQGHVAGAAAGRPRVGEGVGIWHTWASPPDSG